MRIPIALSLLLSTSVLLPAQPVRELDLFPAPAVGLEIPERSGHEQWEQGWTMEELLLEYGRITDQRFIYQNDTRAQLGGTRVPLIDSLAIAPKNVHSVVEALLVQSGFVLSIVREADPRLVSVSSMQGNRINLRQGARYVPVDELPLWCDHPAYLVHTLVTLEHMDVRVLTNTMRAMLNDANTEQVIPVGSSHTLMLTGFAPQVEQLVRMLRVANEASRVAFEKNKAVTDEDAE